MRSPRQAKARDESRAEDKQEDAATVLAPQEQEAGDFIGRRPLDGLTGRSRVEDLVEAVNPDGTASGEENLGATTMARHEFHLDDAADQQLSFSGRRFEELGEPLMCSLQQLIRERHCKELTMAMDNVFPLPLGDYPGVPQTLRSWLRAILLGLNSLAGCSQQDNRAKPSELQQKMVIGMLPFLERLCKTVETVPKGGFRDLFNVKGVDYRGEEIKLAMSFKWAIVAGALPKEVATLELTEFCTDGCRFFTEDFSRFLVPEEQQHLGRTPRVMVADEDWFDVCKGLLESEICGVLPRSKLHHIGGPPLLNGLFAVSKNEFQGTLELQRLIMNLVPLNRNCVCVKGDVSTLPTTAGFSAFYLLDNEVAVMCSEDVKCFYYLFRVPDNWCKYMGFAREVPMELLPEGLRGEPCHLVARVLPMGWCNSVGLAQHIHRNVVAWSMSGVEGGGEQELRRGKTAPLTNRMHRVYLDNRDEIRRVDKHLVEEVEGVPSIHQLALRQQYEMMEVPRHPKKAVVSSTQAEIQGAVLDGQSGCQTQQDLEVHGVSLGVSSEAIFNPQGVTGCNRGACLYFNVPPTFTQRSEPCVGTHGNHQTKPTCGPGEVTSRSPARTYQVPVPDPIGSNGLQASHDEASNGQRCLNIRWRNLNVNGGHALWRTSHGNPGTG